MPPFASFPQLLISNVSGSELGPHESTTNAKSIARATVETPYKGHLQLVPSVSSCSTLTARSYTLNAPQPTNCSGYHYTNKSDLVYTEEYLLCLTR